MTNTLTVSRDWQSPYNQTTFLRDQNNKLKFIIRSINQQPKKGLKQITLNNKTYNLNWQ